MTPRWKKATYTAVASLGLFTGAAGIAAAATGSSNPPATNSASADAPEQGDTPDAADTAEAPDRGVEVDGVDCVDGVDAATGAECDGGPSANATDDAGEPAEEQDGSESAGDEAAYASSITVADSGHETDDAAEAGTLAQIATISADQASQAALAAVPGTVDKVELDNENGSVVYSVEIRTDAGLIDVKVDAGTGAILAQEADDGESEAGGHGDAAEEAENDN